MDKVKADTPALCTLCVLVASSCGDRLAPGSLAGLAGLAWGLGKGQPRRLEAELALSPTSLFLPSAASPTRNSQI